MQCYEVSLFDVWMAWLYECSTTQDTSLISPIFLAPMQTAKQGQGNGLAAVRLLRSGDFSFFLFSFLEGRKKTSQLVCYCFFFSVL
jgi:hypothetical protein